MDENTILTKVGIVERNVWWQIKVTWKSAVAAVLLWDTHLWSASSFTDHIDLFSSVFWSGQVDVAFPAQGWHLWECGFWGVYYDF
jgi:hypothetical protein